MSRESMVCMERLEQEKIMITCLVANKGREEGGARRDQQDGKTAEEVKMDVLNFSNQLIQKIDRGVGGCILQMVNERWSFWLCICSYSTSTAERYP